MTEPEPLLNLQASATKVEVTLNIALPSCAVSSSNDTSFMRQVVSSISRIDL